MTTNGKTALTATMSGPALLASTRARRVSLLILGIILLSVADLLITVTHLRSVGMMEANPIAAFLIRTTRSPWILVAYKSLTVSLCAVLLFHARRHVTGELAAWLSLFILAGMSVLWHRYSTHFDQPEQIRLAQSAAGPDEWLYLD